MQPNRLADADEWFIRADRDLQAAALALNADPTLGESVAFHAQQAAEKAFKGYLTAYSIAFPKTHELEGLVMKCAAIEPEFQQFMTAASILTPYVAEFRYPGQRLEPPVSEARTAYQYATDILQFVRDTLANAAPPPSN